MDTQTRLIAGIENVPSGKMPMFFTLTFPLADAPDEDEAHRAWRSLVARLRYRDYLGAYGWVPQRQRNGTLHFHGIAHMPWFADGLAEWRELLVKSRFGVQNKLVVANLQHTGYCAKYISTRLADSRRFAARTDSRLTSLAPRRSPIEQNWPSGTASCWIATAIGYPPTSCTSEQRLDAWNSSGATLLARSVVRTALRRNQSRPAAIPSGAC